jgi:hypothetical protein
VKSVGLLRSDSESNAKNDLRLSREIAWQRDYILPSEPCSALPQTVDLERTTHEVAVKPCF